MSKDEVQIRTFIDYQSGTVALETWMCRVDSQTMVARRVICTEDREIREALIRMGWTPPDSIYQQLEFKGAQEDGAGEASDAPGGTDVPPAPVETPGDTFSPLRGSPEEALILARRHQESASLVRDPVAYWKRRAILAEKLNSEYSWKMDNYQRDAQIRRDREIGEMGGGG